MNFLITVIHVGSILAVTLLVIDVTMSFLSDTKQNKE